LFTLAIGLPGAYLFARYEFRGKSLLMALTAIPFVLPALVVAAAFSSLLGPRGWINLALMALFNLSQPPIEFINTLTAILLAHVFYNTVIVIRMVGDFWSHLDPRLTQTARTLGANHWQALKRITLPLLAPSVATAALLVFIFDFTSFGVILILGGPRFATLEVEIYYQTISLFNLPLAATLAIIQLVCTLMLTIFYTRLTLRLSAPLNLRSRRYTQKRLTTWKSRILAACLIVVLLGLLTLPLIALATRSITRLEPGLGQETLVAPSLTLDFYRELSVNRTSSLFYVPPTTAIAISLGYASVTILLALALGLPAAWALSRYPHANQ
jgi:thiamine transport system permease protein